MRQQIENWVNKPQSRLGEYIHDFRYLRRISVSKVSSSKSSRTDLYELPEGASIALTQKKSRFSFRFNRVRLYQDTSVPELSLVIKGRGKIKDIHAKGPLEATVRRVPVASALVQARAKLTVPSLTWIGQADGAKLIVQEDAENTESYNAGTVVVRGDVLEKSGTTADSQTWIVGKARGVFIKGADKRRTRVSAAEIEELIAMGQTEITAREIITRILYGDNNRVF